MQRSTLQLTWASRTLCLVSGSKCQHPIFSWQNLKLYVSRSPSQTLQEIACTSASLPLGSHRQSVPPTLSRPHFWTPKRFAPCVASVYVIAGNKNQQKLDDKFDTCKHSLAGIGFVFLQCESWDHTANVLKNCDI